MAAVAFTSLAYEWSSLAVGTYFLALDPATTTPVTLLPIALTKLQLPASLLPSRIRTSG